jgi:hypothetical protein
VRVMPERAERCAFILQHRQHVRRGINRYRDCRSVALFSAVSASTPSQVAKNGQQRCSAGPQGALVPPRITTQFCAALR